MSITSGLAIALVAIASGCSPALLPAGPAPATRPTAEPTSNRLLGSGGCAARGCHGGPATNAAGEPEAKWSNAYTFALRFDRHSLAFSALEDAPARAIIARLQAGQPEANWQDAAAEPRCLACHVTPQLALLNEPNLRAEGVSCDACHTRPGRATTEWLGPHQVSRSSGWSDTDYERHGLARLDTPARRAAVCVGCHVGAPASAGVPVREVTHDLIAAGHPRLNFEIGTFLALMPPHWHEPTQGPGAPAHAWFDGQIENAKAGLALHADRVERVSRGEKVAWPELAEWNCFACHHDLSPKSADWRGRRAIRTPGRPTWTGGNISKPLRLLLGPESPTRVAYDRLGSLAIRGGRTSASAGSARELARILEGMNSPIAAADPAAGAKLIAALELSKRSSSGELARLDWDDAAQTYYALRAASRCGRPAKDEADRALDRIAGLLRLPRNPTINSPAQYDPAAVARAFVEFDLAFHTARR